jgi:hypothetical protein
MTIPLYIDRFGGVPAVKEFFFSLLKTMLAAGITYLVVRLSEVNATTPELVGLIALVRAFLTSSGKYLTTTTQG